VLATTAGLSHAVCDPQNELRADSIGDHAVRPARTHAKLLPPDNLRSPDDSLAAMPKSTAVRITAQPPLPSQREWERSPMLEPRVGPREPALVSDGGGLAFNPGVLAGEPSALDPQDPAVAALLAGLIAQAKPKRSLLARRAHTAQGGAPQTMLAGWRELARNEREALFGRGQPPALITAAIRRDALRRRWSTTATSAARPLRVVRDGMRASSWRLDPEQELSPTDTLLRLLVTEQSFASGQRADGRVLAPDVYPGDDEIILTIFVTPRPGYQTAARNPETPVRVALTHPVGSRQLIDGALAQFPAPPGSRARATDE
jgi:hypothetical protein